MEVKEKDFVAVDFDLYANGELVQTTDKKKAKEKGIESQTESPFIMTIGKGFVLKALDEDIKKVSKEKEKRTLELKAEDAYGTRRKDFIKTLPKSAFDEQQMKIVPGMTYDFNGMYGTVKSLTGGRVLVDFNNPLAGKEIKIEYTFVKKVMEMKTKLETVMSTVLRIPKDKYELEIKEKKIHMKGPEALVPVKEMLFNAFKEEIAEVKDYELEIESFKKN